MGPLEATVRSGADSWEGLLETTRSSNEDLAGISHEWQSQGSNQDTQSWSPPSRVSSGCSQRWGLVLRSPGVFVKVGRGSVPSGGPQGPNCGPWTMLSAPLNQLQPWGTLESDFGQRLDQLGRWVVWVDIAHVLVLILCKLKDVETAQ
ncbi:hypothetical protein mRhiFer1_009390 [Rhinolophus ferrumequinum]|uniref:Uncharacterized protein n=1 Tax=Rhinolophus ferrumequinum TaxID=59479 RepID=A0A7J7RPM1_RHIFE|nr:hypothetical protein mRhiFer1_009390 [Rhinolophus ferrumequinum]